MTQTSGIPTGASGGADDKESPAARGMATHDARTARRPDAPAAHADAGSAPTAWTGATASAEATSDSPADTGRSAADWEDLTTDPSEAPAQRWTDGAHTEFGPVRGESGHLPTVAVSLGGARLHAARRTSATSGPTTPAPASGAVTGPTVGSGASPEPAPGSASARGPVMASTPVPPPPSAPAPAPAPASANAPAPGSGSLSPAAPPAASGSVSGAGGGGAGSGTGVDQGDARPPAPSLPRRRPGGSRGAGDSGSPAASEHAANPGGFAAPGNLAVPEDRASPGDFADSGDCSRPAPDPRTPGETPSPARTHSAGTHSALAHSAGPLSAGADDGAEAFGPFSDRPSFRHRFASVPVTGDPEEDGYPSAPSARNGTHAGDATGGSADGDLDGVLDGANAASRARQRPSTSLAASVPVADEARLRDIITRVRVSADDDPGPADPPSAGGTTRPEGVGHRDGGDADRCGGDPRRAFRGFGRPLKVAASAAGVLLVGGSMLLIGRGEDEGGADRARAEQPDPAADGLFTPDTAEDTPRPSPSPSGTGRHRGAPAAEEEKELTSPSALPPEQRRKGKHAAPEGAPPSAATEERRTAPATRAPRRTGTRSVIRATRVLSPGESWSGRRARMTLRADGDLVVTDENGQVRWSAHTSGHGNRVVFQEDGHLVVYSAAHEPLWSSGTAGRYGAVLVLRGDGDVVIVHRGAVVWSTGTAH